ncbi:Serine/threonine-protein kinase dkf-2 [Fusarium oxysporum f. sp. albedinis]|nr:Serine/threonine-protein kinase dkf-2 [Fusarium oxysporum f. sp. albedinis]
MAQPVSTSSISVRDILRNMSLEVNDDPVSVFELTYGGLPCKPREPPPQFLLDSHPDMLHIKNLSKINNWLMATNVGVHRDSHL